MLHVKTVEYTGSGCGGKSLSVSSFHKVDNLHRVVRAHKRSGLYNLNKVGKKACWQSLMCNSIHCIVLFALLHIVKKQLH